jgi:hypothetical protein
MAKAATDHHDAAAQGHRKAAAAHRTAAAKEKDPGRASGHLAEAAKHDAHAAGHAHAAAVHAQAHAEHEAEKKGKGGGLAKFLEKAKEGLAERGEDANKLAEQALEENGLSKAAGELAMRGATMAATGPLNRIKMAAGVGAKLSEQAKETHEHSHKHGKHE